MPFILILILLSSCSKTKVEEKVSVRFNVPTENSGIVNEIADPATIDDINCIGIFLNSQVDPNLSNCQLQGGPDISFASKGGLNFVNTTSTSIVVSDLTLGDQMTSYLVGFKVLGSTSCPNFLGPGFSGFNPGSGSVSHGYLLASQNFAVINGESVGITLTSTTAIPSSNKIENCNIIDESSVDTFGSGSEGDFTVTANTNLTSATINGKAINPARRINSIGANGFALTADSALGTEFEAGDNVLVMVVGEGAASACQASDISVGKFLDTKILSAAGSTMVLEDAFTTDFASIGSMGFYSAVATANTNFCYVQVVRIANLRNLTIDSNLGAIKLDVSPFSFSDSGGVLALKVSEALTVFGPNNIEVDVSHLGHPGATAGADIQGSGARGVGAALNSNISSGGGGGNASAGAGGGGSGPSSGGDGSNNAGSGGNGVESGLSVCGSNECLIFGGGGGGAPAGAGGSGGGIVYIKANSLIASGLTGIFSVAAVGEDATGSNTHAGGGGGEINMVVGDVVGNVSLDTTGGAGTNDGSYFAGGGAGGEISVNFCVGSGTLTRAVVGGASGGGGAVAGANGLDVVNSGVCL